MARELALDPAMQPAFDAQLPVQSAMVAHFRAPLVTHAVARTVDMRRGERTGEEEGQSGQREPVQ